MKPRILVFIDWFLPGYQAGGPVRSIANLIEHLGDEAEFFVMTRNTDYCETKPYEGIEANKWGRFSDNTSVYYFSQDQLTAKNIKHVAENINCDFWYITGVYSRLFSILPARIKTNATKIIAPRGMLSPHAINVKSSKKRSFLLLAKIIKLYQGATFHATNANEAEDIKKIFPKTLITVIPNLAMVQSAITTDTLIKKKDELKLCTVTRIAPEKNTLGAIRKLLELGNTVRNSKTDRNHISVTYDLYGHIYDLDYWEKCKDVIASLPDNIKVNHHGSVSPEKIPEKILLSHFLFLPTHGENFGHAIVEALSLGRPVIISDQTPWTGLEAERAGWDLPLLQTEKFIDVLIRCVAMEQKTYNEWSHSAKQYFSKSSALENTIEAYKTLFSNE